MIYSQKGVMMIYLLRPLENENVGNDHAKKA